MYNVYHIYINSIVLTLCCQIVGQGTADSRVGIVAQLIWREFFYTMSALNPNYGKMEGNPICLPIPWYNNPEQEENVEMVGVSLL